VLVKPTEAELLLEETGLFGKASSVLSVVKFLVSLGTGDGAMGWSLGKDGTIDFSMLSVVKFLVSLGTGDGLMSCSLGKDGISGEASQVEGVGSDEFIFTGSSLGGEGATWMRPRAMLALKACL
jgi:hypothetical protein